MDLVLVFAGTAIPGLPRTRGDGPTEHLSQVEAV